MAARAGGVTLDALGTLVELDRPVARLVAELRARGAVVDEPAAAAALGDEIAFYRAQHDRGVDAASVERLRADCVEVLRGGLRRAGCDVEALDAGALRGALLAALRFRAFDDVAPALARLRAAGHRLVVVSNWDVSLHEMLDVTGLRPLVDGAISSAEAVARKPAPAIFRRALELVGEGAEDGPARALHAGDSLELDVAGARAAGMRAVLVVRGGPPPRGVPDDVPVVASLGELAALAA